MREGLRFNIFLRGSQGGGFFQDSILPVKTVQVMELYHRARCLAMTKLQRWV